MALHIGRNAVLAYEDIAHPARECEIINVFVAFAALLKILCGFNLHRVLGRT